VARRTRLLPFFVVVSLLTTISSAAAAPHKKRRRARATPGVPARVPQVSRGDGAPQGSPIDGQPNVEPPATATARAYATSYDHESAGHFADALRDLNDLPVVEQERYLARLRRGWLLYRLGRHPDSVAAYRQAIALERGSVEARVGSLLPLISLRRWAEVEQEARLALEIDPANYLAGVRLAFAVYNRARYPEAETLYRRVLGFYPSDADARAGLGWSLLKQGRRGDARQAFLEASYVAPRSPAIADGLIAAGR
jgi:tetratricopeptide (TPR) repeat protein